MENELLKFTIMYATGIVIALIYIIIGNRFTEYKVPKCICALSWAFIFSELSLRLLFMFKRKLSQLKKYFKKN